jgi:SAM-dependent methyltransferase
VSTQASDSFWESAEAVERFTDREPDVRLLDLLNRYADPARVRVLDIGCAAGRNTVCLAERGFDVFAIDSSAAMVARTRERVARILGQSEAERRVLLGRMDDLRAFADASVDVAVALGVLHQAGSEDQWRGSIAEIVRTLVPGGFLILASWSPRSRPRGEAVRQVEGTDNLYTGFHSGTHYLVEAPALDAALASAGLAVAEPTREVRVETENGWRVTINGLYRRVES